MIFESWEMCLHPAKMDFRRILYSSTLTSHVCREAKSCRNPWLNRHTDFMSGQWHAFFIAIDIKLACGVEYPSWKNGELDFLLFSQNQSRHRARPKWHYEGGVESTLICLFFIHIGVTTHLRDNHRFCRPPHKTMLICECTNTETSNLLSKYHLY